MKRLRLVVRGVSVALLLGCVASAIALTSGRPVGSTGPSPASIEQVRGAVAAGKLLFVGASYTVGLGATAGAGYAPVVAASLDRRYSVAAVSGTGFLNPGPHHEGTFGQRIARLPAGLDPRIVVIQGGRNDAGYDPRELQAAVRSAIRLAEFRFDHAQVVVMGPIPAQVPVGPLLLRTRDVIGAAARQTGAGFVDPIAQGWITRENEQRYAGPVPFHPNDAGYRYIAGRLLDDLPAALDAAQPPVGTRADAPDAPATAPPRPPAPASPTPTPAATVGERDA